MTDIVRKSEQLSLKPFFGKDFLDNHVGNLITKPGFAIVEIIANAWDAGADTITISWPGDLYKDFICEDNGTGMTPEEFEFRWMNFGYNRLAYQGEEVIFPSGNKNSLARKAFGRNGKGRHSIFCFGDKYNIETWCNGKVVSYDVIRSNTEGSELPYQIQKISEGQKPGHGTKITTNLVKNYIPISEIRTIIGTRFIADPSVNTFVNGVLVKLTDISEMTESRTIETALGNVDIHFVGSDTTGKTSRQNGIAWWVNNKLVGDISWHRYSDNRNFLDARTIGGRRFTFIVIGDVLVEHVCYDWSGFNMSTSIKARETIDQIENSIDSWLDELTRVSKIESKRQILRNNRADIEDLPKTGQEFVSHFIDEAQNQIPTLAFNNLDNAVKILITLEQARSGKELLAQLARLTPEDFNMLNSILEKWSVRDAKAVLDELQWRLELIIELERLVDNPESDELHEIQPLFETGLWIFGPEYEARDFIANRTIQTIIREFFKQPGWNEIPNEMRRRRPDIVTTSDSTITSYGMDKYDPENGEPIGLEKILIIELKRGGYSLSKNEMRQAEDYAQVIRSHAGISPSKFCITCYVIGSTINNAEEMKVGENEIIRIIPTTYLSIIRKAKVRTFNLLDKIQKLQLEILQVDQDIEAVLAEPKQLML